MSFMSLRLALAASASSLLATPAMAQDRTPLTDIIVLGQRDNATTETVDGDSAVIPLPDTANLIARLPGADINDNGPLSGQVQYRGVTGERVLTRINGQRFSSGGPNAMDPPLHYAPLVLVDVIKLDRSVGPVRHGPSLGGSVNAMLKAPRFDDGLQADLSAGWRSADSSTTLGGLVGYGDEQLRIGLLASHEQGSDLRFPGGRVSATSFERLTLGGTLGLRAAGGEFTLEYRRSETDPSGNPPFAMDILYFDTDFLRAAYEGDLADNVRLEISGGYASVAHLMDNHSLRPAPADPSRLRASFADADSYSGQAALIFGSATRHVRLGGDYETSTKDVRITNPANADFFIQTLNGAKAERFGAHAEWRGALGPVESELGLRFDEHRMTAGPAETGAAVPMMPAMLGMAFTQGNRAWSGSSLDLVGRFWMELGTITPRLVLARKTRAPNAVERFSWLPTEASGGLADGNIYVGNPDLEVEKAWIAEAGFDWSAGGFHVRPTLNYRRIEDYIQGVPFDATPGVIDSPVEMVAAMNGDATPLRFANVEAEIWGADLDFGLALHGPLRVDGTASFVRGARKDIADNLYRIAPASLRLALGWVEDGWNVALEGVGFASQNRVSATNSEQPTDGFVIANVLFGVKLGERLRLDGGIENLFNREYVEHLAGYNRVSGGDVAVGARLPGAGRSAFARLSFVL